MAKNTNLTMAGLRQMEAKMKADQAQQEQKQLTAITVALTEKERKDQIPITMAGLRQLEQLMAPNITMGGLRRVEKNGAGRQVGRDALAKIQDEKKAPATMDGLRQAKESFQTYGMENVADPSSIPIEILWKNRLADARLEQSERRINKINELKNKNIDGTVYIESDHGNVDILGKKYFQRNSDENLGESYTIIDYEFQNGDYNKLLDSAVSMAKYYQQPGIYALTESVGGLMDQKRNLKKNTLYLFNGKLYNRNEAGNIIWGAAMRWLGFDQVSTVYYANLAAQLLEQRLDEDHDLRAIVEGWNYNDNPRY